MKKQMLHLTGVSVVAVALISTALLQAPSAEASHAKAHKKAHKKVKSKPKPKPRAKKAVVVAAASGAPTAAIVSQKMREMWEEPASPGMDGATTVVIHSVIIGTPHKWDVFEGGGGSIGTRVWPAKVHWTYRTHYRTRTSVSERFWNVSCFKNGFNEWVVQQNGDGEKEIGSEEPSTMQ